MPEEGAAGRTRTVELTPVKSPRPLISAALSTVRCDFKMLHSLINPTETDAHQRRYYARSASDNQSRHRSHNPDGSLIDRHSPWRACNRYRPFDECRFMGCQADSAKQSKSRVVMGRCTHRESAQRTCEQASPGDNDGVCRRSSGGCRGLLRLYGYGKNHRRRWRHHRAHRS